MLEKRRTAKRYKRFGTATSRRGDSTPVARRENQTLSNGTHGASFASADTTELSEGLGILGV